MQPRPGCWQRPAAAAIGIRATALTRCRACACGWWGRPTWICVSLFSTSSARRDRCCRPASRASRGTEDHDTAAPSYRDGIPYAIPRTSAFQCAGDEPAYVIALQRDVDDHARDHRDDGPGEKQSVVDRAVGPGFHIAQGDGEGEQAVVGQEAQCPEELCPGEQERVQRGG